MNKRYRCTKPFVVDTYDSDGFFVEEGAMTVGKWTVWEHTCDGYIIGAYVHLESENGWLEVSHEDLEAHFEEVLGDGS